MLVWDRSKKNSFGSDIHPNEIDIKLLIFIKLSQVFPK